MRRSGDDTWAWQSDIPQGWTLSIEGNDEANVAFKLYPPLVDIGGVRNFLHELSRMARS